MTGLRLTFGNGPLANSFRKMPSSKRNGGTERTIDGAQQVSAYNLDGILQENNHVCARDAIVCLVVQVAIKARVF